MARLVSVNHFVINPKEYNGRRVVTFKDIDLVHGRADGTARYRFRDNKKHFIEGEDYFVVTPQTLENAKLGEIRPIGIESVSVRGTTFLTETGYFMLVKSFTDDLAWSVQRELVNNYFKVKIESKREEPVFSPEVFEPTVMLYVIDTIKRLSAFGQQELLKSIYKVMKTEGCMKYQR